MIDPKKELFKWGPIEGRPIYVDIWNVMLVDFPNFFDGSWPDMITYLKDDTILAISDYQKLRDNGEHLFKKYVLDEKELNSKYKTWLKAVKELISFENRINKGLMNLSSKQLNKLFIKWIDKYNRFWIYGLLPEICNFGAEQMLKKRILESYPSDFIKIFEKLSAPEDFSFFQIEEMEFMKIKLVKSRKMQEKMLRQHQKRYYWLRNNYGFTKILDVSYFREEIGKISVKNAKNKTKEINNYAKRVKENKRKIIAKYRISSDMAEIAHKLSYCVWWQDMRKKYIFIANHIITAFMQEIGKRKDIDFKELCYYTLAEIIGLLQKNIRADAKQRFGGFIEYYHERGNISYMEGEEANEFIEPYIKVEVEEDIKEIKGMVVSSGKKVVGEVKIIKDLRNLEKMRKGNILVAAMTSPDYIIAMRKAAAIITDEGNMTCHAAIVSRELKIPCIVGTKIATNVLKDGDYVEVDANEGVIKIIK
ncbi:hypothetical protein HYU07_04770 [Candidatus Woesearchaeota archaeon]|nr:hypothetical protein [Candidatus Woesearchaeota archaeon]